MYKYFLASAMCAALTLTGCDVISNGASASARERVAHALNNRADLLGDGVIGQAIVGHTNETLDDGWSSASLQGDLAAGTYGYYVSLDGAGETLVCSFDVTRMDSRQGCAADANLPRFNTAVVRDAEGVPLASGVFARRGGDRAG